jgi:hypothetical protein
LHESFVSLGSVFARCGLRLFRQGRRRHQPEANEQSDGLDGDPQIAFQPFYLSGDPVEPPR